MSEENLTWIGKYELLVERFGYWPSFHDAEVLRFEITRGPCIPDEEQWGDMSILVTLFLWEYAEPDELGHLHRKKLTLATIRFDGVEGLNLEFQGQYRDINGLSVERNERDDGPSPFYSVEFEKFPGGFGASLRCYRIEVVSVDEADEHGRRFF